MSDYLVQLLEAERQAALLGLRARALETDRVPALEQGLHQQWSMNFGVTCTTTLEGAILGCKGVLLPQSQIRIVGDTTATDYGTISTPDGNWETAIQINPAEDLRIYYQGPSGRFVEVEASGSPYSHSAIKCQVNTLSNFLAYQDPHGASLGGIASGYGFHAGCNVPLATTLNFTDSRRGVTDTLLYEGTNLWARRFAINHQYFLDASGGFLFISMILPSGPVLGWPTTASSQQLPDGTVGGPKFDSTWTWVGAGSGPYVAGDTIRIWES